MIAPSNPGVRSSYLHIYTLYQHINRFNTHISRLYMNISHFYRDCPSSNLHKQPNHHQIKKDTHFSSSFHPTRASALPNCISTLSTITPTVSTRISHAFT